MAGSQPADGAGCAVIAHQGGAARLRNRRSGWVAFTVARPGFTDVLTVSPTGRELHYVVSVTDTGTKTDDSPVASASA